MDTAPELSLRSDSGERSMLRRWLMVSLFASIAIHLGLVGVFRVTRLEGFSHATERLVPRAFSVKRVDIDPKLLEDTAQRPDPQTPKKTEELPDIIVPKEQETFEELMQDVRATPTTSELVKPLMAEQPNPETGSMKEIATRKGSTQELRDALAAMSDSLVENAPSALTDALLSSNLPSSSAATALATAAGGYSDLDGLLAQSGQLKAGTAPILMPTDLLFDYGLANLRGAAIQSLQKLGALIKRNPRARFVIEGHTDSYGPEDANLVLSQQRADSVKQWIVRNTGVNPSQISTRGYGETKLIAPGTGSIEAQQINRRVEIVIRAPE